MWINIKLDPKKLKFLRILFSVCFLGTLILIFSFSLQHAPDSLEKSQAVTDAVNEVSFLFLTEGVIRKIAHFCEFALVGFWLILLLNTYLCRADQRILTSLFMGLFIPLIDETIQLFIPDRTGLVADIWLDFSGIICGVIAGYIAMRVFMAVGKRYRML